MRKLIYIWIWVLITGLLVMSSAAQKGSSTIESSQKGTEIMGIDDSRPNNLDPGAALEFVLYEKGEVSITLYNLIGKRISIVLNDRKPAGAYTYRINTDTLPPGIYFYELRILSEEGSEQFRTVRKLIILK